MENVSPMDSQPEALVFDFDGVIADTEPLYWRAWRELLSAYNVPFEWEDYCKIGRGIRDDIMLQSLAQQVSEPDLALRIVPRLPERKEMIRRWNAEQSPISKPTVELLKSLKGLKVGLVTSSDRPEVEPMLNAAGIIDCFNACVFGEEITRHKPDPAPYFLIRQKLAISGGVAFEDSAAGLLSATSAGFQTIRVPIPEDLPELVQKLLTSDRTGD
jgi:beta-phosphoglucomutase